MELIKSHAQYLSSGKALGSSLDLISLHFIAVKPLIGLVFTPPDSITNRP